MPPGPRFEKLVKQAKARIKEVTATVAARLQSQGATLIDVREADEFANEHAAGALHLGRGVIELKIEREVPDAATPVVCYCGGGSRSALVADNLRQMGYENVASLVGGFKAWKDAALPTET